VIGKTPDEAQKQFEQAGFTNIQIGQLSSSVLPSGAPKQKKGTVAAVINGQDLRLVNAGQSIPKDTPIIIIVQATD
jgi:hypothetical protein